MKETEQPLFTNATYTWLLMLGLMAACQLESCLSQNQGNHQSEISDKVVLISTHQQQQLRKLLTNHLWERNTIFYLPSSEESEDQYSVVNYTDGSFKTKEMLDINPSGVWKYYIIFDYFWYSSWIMLCSASEKSWKVDINFNDIHLRLLDR